MVKRLIFPQNKKKLSKQVTISTPKQVSRIIRPFGFLASYVISGKMLLQEIWMTGSGWDEPLPYELSSKIDSQELSNLPSMEIPRCLQAHEETAEISLHVHVFKDASEKAYGSVIYQRTIYTSGNISSRLILSKSKVAPLKATSIPRLELMSAVLGLRVAKKVVEGLKIDMNDVTFWCDNLNDLWWIRGMSRNFKSFVANRVSEIQTNSNPVQWRHVRTKINPADLISRGTSIEKLSNDKLWLEGPTFLVKDEVEWPTRKLDIPPKIMSEQKKTISSNGMTTLLTVNNAEKSLFPPSTYSKWRRFIRINAWITRFVDNCRSPFELRDIGELSVDEINDSEVRVIRTMQDEFSEEYKLLANRKGLSSRSKILMLHPKLDDNGLI